MVRVKFYMKSGNIIEFKCESIELAKNDYGTLIGYNVNHGNSKEKLISADITNIEGITTRELDSMEG